MAPLVGEDGDIGLAIKGRLVNLTHNWDQSRQYHASLSQRVEGFTETWGDTRSHPRSNTTSSSAHDDRASDKDWTYDEERSVEHILELPYPQQSITLFQYRPAWEEQLALHVLGKTFVVVNCPFAVWETTGPLPCLRDLHVDDDDNVATRNAATGRCRPPALVGRHQRLDSSSTGSLHFNSILHYLQVTHIVPRDGKRGDSNDTYGWDRGLLDEAQKSQAQLFVELVRGTIEPCLALLNLEWTAHEQVYRSLAIRASCRGHLPPPWWSRCHGWWQVWSERLHSKRQLSPSVREMSVQQALERSRDALQLLEQHLVKLHSDGTGFFMGTESAVMIDIVLWACLARCLSNLHMVTVLAEFPALCRYTQHVWDTYFDDPKSTSTEPWREWNARENERNAFGQLPMMQPPATESASPHDFTNALELMRHLSLQRHDLHEQLVLAAEQRTKDPHFMHAAPFQTFHRWRFGDSYRPNQTHYTTSAAHAALSSQEGQEEKALREYQKHDEFWIATVVAASAAAALLLGYAG